MEYFLFTLILQIAQEFGLVVQQPDIRDGFKKNFLDWSKAVIKYCKESQVNNYAVQTMLSKEKDGTSILYTNLHNQNCVIDWSIK